MGTHSNQLAVDAAALELELYLNDEPVEAVNRYENDRSAVGYEEQIAAAQMVTTPLTQCPTCGAITAYNAAGIGTQIATCANKHTFFADVNRVADRYAPHGKKVTISQLYAAGFAVALSPAITAVIILDFLDDDLPALQAFMRRAGLELVCEVW